MSPNLDQLTEWYSMDDENVCPDCRKLTGKKMLLREWIEQGLKPGEAGTVCGINCRCVLGPAGLSADSVVEKIINYYADNITVKRIDPKSEAELKYESQEWKDDMQAIHKIENDKKTDVVDKLLKKSEITKQEIETIIEPYYRELLTIGSKMKYPGELQMGYRIDSLTKMLVKYKEWNKAKYWLETFFGLQSSYRERSNATEQKQMKKRLERCYSKLVKDLNEKEI